MKDLNLSSCFTHILLFQNKMYKKANVYTFEAEFSPYASNLLIPLVAHASFIVPLLVISY